MSVHHLGYGGGGIEDYVARQVFHSNTPLQELVDAVDGLRRELFAHRSGMEVQSSNKATISVWLGTSNVAVSIRGWWLDRDALESEELMRKEHGR